MKICDLDLTLLNAFLIREAQDFTKNEEKQKQYSIRMLWEITQRIKEIPKANWISIQSLTNMGLKDRELRLTPINEWTHKDIMVEIYLPPSLNGSFTPHLTGEDHENSNKDKS